MTQPLVHEHASARSWRADGRWHADDSCSAGDFTGTGEGDSIEEAEQQAADALAAHIAEQEQQA